MVTITGDMDELKQKLCASLLPAIQAPGHISRILKLPRTTDVIFNRTIFEQMQRNVGVLLIDETSRNRWYAMSFNQDDMLKKALKLQSIVEEFHGADYSEDTIYRESIDELVFMREKKEFYHQISALMVDVVHKFSTQMGQQWFQQLITPVPWQLKSGVHNRQLDEWLDDVREKVSNFLGDVEPVNLGWLADPLRYLSAVEIRHLISASLGTTSTELLITLSGISDIHELKEGLHAGCYAVGIYLYGAKWETNEEGPVPITDQRNGDEVRTFLVMAVPFLINSFSSRLFKTWALSVWFQWRVTR